MSFVKKIKLSVIVVCLQVLTIGINAQPEFSSINSAVGSFSRMGFGARGIAMGNAMSAVKEGSLVSYYNPAVTVFQNDNSANLGYSFLSLDRSLNFLSFTRRFDFYSSKDTILENRKPRSTAGFSFGIINSGVSKIDGRDNQGIKTGDLSTSENQFFFAVGIRFSQKLSFGLNTKFYYYKLYEDISTTGFGMDIGFLYLLNSNISLSFVMSDLNSKYKFDSSPVYSTEGTATENQFPLGKKIGLSYNFNEIPLLAATEFYFDNFGTKMLRIGCEYKFDESIVIRGGLDNFHINNTDQPIKPSLGFSFMKPVSGIKIAVDYAFAYEPYTAMDKHIVGLNFIF